MLCATCDFKNSDCAEGGAFGCHSATTDHLITSQQFWQELVFAIKERVVSMFRTDPNA